jgi:hypothetical protein
MHTYHSPEWGAEVSQIFLRDTHVLPKLVNYSYLLFGLRSDDVVFPRFGLFPRYACLVLLLESVSRLQLLSKLSSSGASFVHLDRTENLANEIIIIPY